MSMPTVQTWSTVINAHVVRGIPAMGLCVVTLTNVRHKQTCVTSTPTAQTQWVAIRVRVWMASLERVASVMMLTSVWLPWTTIVMTLIEPTVSTSQEVIAVNVSRETSAMAPFVMVSRHIDFSVDGHYLSFK